MKAFQLCKYDGPKARRHIKRTTARAMRRAGKRQRDDAPRRVTKGWWT